MVFWLGELAKSLNWKHIVELLCFTVAPLQKNIHYDRRQKSFILQQWGKRIYEFLLARLEWNLNIDVRKLRRFFFVYSLRVFMICLTLQMSSICKEGGDGSGRILDSWSQIRRYGCVSICTIFEAALPPTDIEPTIEFVFPDRTVISLPLESNVIEVLIMSKDISVCIFIQRYVWDIWGSTYSSC